MSPSRARERFRYHAGQFLTLRVHIDGCEHRRCYSMSSSPVLGRTYASPSNAIATASCRTGSTTTAAAGDELDAAPPAGSVRAAGTPIVSLIAFAGGSGITPVFSLLRSALVSTARGTPAVLR